jgi:hypothetical protein
MEVEERGVDDKSQGDRKGDERIECENRHEMCVTLIHLLDRE